MLSNKTDYTSFFDEITHSNEHSQTAFSTTTPAHAQGFTFKASGPIIFDYVRSYEIKKVIVNPKKNATTVIFKDKSVVVVKRHPNDPESDIYSVVAYAVAKHVYGSNSAFKKQIDDVVEVLEDKKHEEKEE